MTNSELHLDTDQIVAIATGHTDVAGPSEHLSTCSQCRGELARWQRVAKATKDWAASDNSLDRQLPPLVLNDTTAEGTLHIASHPRFRRYSLIAVAAAVTAAALSVIFTVQSSTPSDAAILKQVMIAGAKADEVVSRHTVETNSSSASNVQHVVIDSNPTTGAYRNVIAVPYQLPIVLEGVQGSYTYSQVIAVVKGLPIKHWCETIYTPSPKVARPTTPNPPAPIPENGPGQLEGADRIVAQLGTRTINGVPVTGYRVEISVTALLKEATTTALQSYYRTDYLAWGVKSWLANVWIDQHGQVRDMSWSIRFKNPTTHQYVSGTTTAQYSYSSKPFVVTPPPANDTMVVTPATQAVCTGL